MFVKSRVRWDRFQLLAPRNFDEDLMLLCLDEVSNARAVLTCGGSCAKGVEDEPAHRSSSGPYQCQATSEPRTGWRERGATSAGGSALLTLRVEALVRRWMSLIGPWGFVLTMVACGGESDGDPRAGNDGGEGAQIAGSGSAGTTASGGTSTASGGTTAQGGGAQAGNAQGGNAQGGNAQGGNAQGGNAQGGTAQGGSVHGGTDGGDSGEPGDGGSPAGECSDVAEPPEGTKLCGTPAEVALISGLLGLEASFRYALSSGDCGVRSGFDVSAATEDVFVFRKEEDYGNNVSILYPWDYTLVGHDDSNNLPSGELITAHIKHECGLAFAIDFTFGADDSVNVSDVRSEE
jgi:hypothetical protein